MPVTESTVKKNNPQVNGYYLEIGGKQQTREVKIFYSNGYVASLLINKSDFYNNFKRQLKTKLTSPIPMAWYISRKDSVILELFGENPNEIATYSFNYYGRIYADTLSLWYENSKKIITYKFIEDLNITKFTNDSRYANKKWYKKNLHDSRK